MENLNFRFLNLAFHLAIDKKFQRIVIILLCGMLLSSFVVIFTEKNYSNSLERVVQADKRIIDIQDSIIMNYKHHFVKIEELFKK